MQGVPLLSSCFHLSCVVGTCDTNLSAKGFHFTKNSVIVSSVDDINVEGRFSWLDISVLALILQTRYLCVRFLVQRYDIFLARWEIMGNNGEIVGNNIPISLWGRLLV